MSQQEFLNLCECDVQRLVFWEPISTGGNQWKSDAPAVQLIRQGKGFLITGMQHISFAMASVYPFRPYRMDNIAGIQVKCIRTGCLAWSNLSNLLSGYEKLLFPCGLIDCAVSSSSNSWFWICSIDNGIRFHFCDVITDDLKRHATSPQSLFYASQSFSPYSSQSGSTRRAEAIASIRF